MQDPKYNCKGAAPAIKKEDAKGRMPLVSSVCSFSEHCKSAAQKLKTVNVVRTFNCKVQGCKRWAVCR